MAKTDKLIRVHTAPLQNEVHFRFHTENEKLYRKYDPAQLGIATFMPAYRQALKDEDIVMERIRKSSETPRIADADKLFDGTYLSLRYQLLSYLRHFKPELRCAAENLDVVFHQYGNIGKQPYRKQLALSWNFIQELRKHEADIRLLHLETWVSEHEMAQQQFATLLDGRAKEKAGKTDLRTREVRTTIDAIYQNITSTIDVMIKLNGRDYAGGFYAAYNEHATEYKHTQAQHLGRRHKYDGEAPEDE